VLGSEDRISLGLLQLLLFPSLSFVAQRAKRTELFQRDIVGRYPHPRLKHKVQVGRSLKQQTGSGVFEGLFQLPNRAVFATYWLPMSVILPVRCLIAIVRPLAEPVFVKAPIG
jgi:hypothetical protein